MTMNYTDEKGQIPKATHMKGILSCSDNCVGDSITCHGHSMGWNACMNFHDYHICWTQTSNKTSLCHGHRHRHHQCQCTRVFDQPEDLTTSGLPAVKDGFLICLCVAVLVLLFGRTALFLKQHWRNRHSQETPPAPRGRNTMNPDPDYEEVGLRVHSSISSSRPQSTFDLEQGHLHPHPSDDRAHAFPMEEGARGPWPGAPLESTDGPAYFAVELPMAPDDEPSYSTVRLEKQCGDPTYCNVRSPVIDSDGTTYAAVKVPTSHHVRPDDEDDADC
ncbi:uncharacterized protein LOC134452229 [Engraulis encrasicolus]|uniref:uncharacterized protein LOC134452229 n=1 Tax=Engraulis encrasicolus TaxID=184585 RepID=UPI002FD49847